MDVCNPKMNCSNCRTVAKHTANFPDLGDIFACFCLFFANFG